MAQNSSSSGNYSETTANLIDQEIRRIIDEQYERVIDILRSKRNIIHQAAKKLLEKEIIEGEELKALSDAVSQQSTSESDDGILDDRRALAA
jgi:cell division protease FtsH